MTNVESDYYAFMHFDREAMREGRTHYVQFFDAGPVLELACGRGEFLELLAEVGIEASGVDIDSGMVEAGRERGCEIALADALVAIAERPPSSLQGLFCAHFLEHLPSEQVEQVYLEAARVLRPGGRFVAVVPNMGSLAVALSDFWRDPTHVRPYDPVVLAFFAERAGLTVVESGPNPAVDPGAPPHIRPIEPVSVAAVGDELAALVEEIRRVHGPKVRRRTVGDLIRGRRPVADGELEPAGSPWNHLTEIVTRLDASIQTLQHHLYDLRASYDRALEQLYPPNEVYVVARKEAPAGDG